MDHLDLPSVDDVCLTCGYTDIRQSIDGFADIIDQQFQMRPFSSTNFFCGRRGDHAKELTLWCDGFLFLYQR